MRIRDPGWKESGSGIRDVKNFGSGIRDNHPGSATLVKAIPAYLDNIFYVCAINNTVKECQ
jgi:hypothetical protein